MTKECFQEQMNRMIGTYGERAYPPERLKTIWLTFQRLPDGDFVDVVSHLIMNYRATPLMKEFHDAATEADTRRKEAMRTYGSGSVADILRANYVPASYEDPNARARIEGRLKLVSDYTNRRISKMQFADGCDFYDRAGGITLNSTDDRELNEKFKAWSENG